MDVASACSRVSVLPEFAGAEIAKFWTVACSQDVSASVDQFLEVTNLLLERVQLNSTHLFRADILWDSTGELCTLAEKESTFRSRAYGFSTVPIEALCEDMLTYTAPDIPQFELQRTIIRRLVPRKPQLDKPLEQSCFVYKEAGGHHQSSLVIYLPHCDLAEEIPWYHPKVRALAYLFLPLPGSSKISIQYLAFTGTHAERSTRLERTCVSLLNTMTRLLKLPSKDKGRYTDHPVFEQNVMETPLTAEYLRDTILPQHMVQNTYARLKQTYASDLIARWTEKTEPAKHVFEDLSIAAFLIELWNFMYGLTPDDLKDFPGFVDVACGNGVLVYVLVNEGYRGYGFDARRRKTWAALDIEKHVEERICIPGPFLEAVSKNEDDLDGLNLSNSYFPVDTFIISNHADELTCWTPILAALSFPERPLPFLAIPCCSHALDGSKHRYTLKEVKPTSTSYELSEATADDIVEEQPANGDLKTLKQAKEREIAGYDNKSMYACLTRKTAALAQELGIEVELTLMRIPSTRNIGIVGNRRRQYKSHDHLNNIEAIVDRECRMTGGVEKSARTWVDKARKLQYGQGRGKVNLKGLEH